MNHPKPENSLLIALCAYAENIAQAESAEMAFRCAEQSSRDLIGHRLFTIMRFMPDTMEVQRCYSSNPSAYPTGGRKAKKQTQWGRDVLEQGRPFLGNSISDIRENFTDHQVIEGLGLGSVLNMPIRHLGQTIGTMNLLHEAGFYQRDHVAIATIIVSALGGVLITASLGG